MSAMVQAGSTATPADWLNAIASLVAAAGTIFALGFSAVALRDRRRDRHEAEMARRTVERAQAEKVLAWTTAVGPSSDQGTNRRFLEDPAPTSSSCAGSARPRPARS